MRISDWSFRRVLFRSPHQVLRGAEDWMVDDLFGAAPLEGASLLAARFPRAYIDPNRRLDDVDPVLLDGTWPEPLSPGPKSALGIGLSIGRASCRARVCQEV